MRHVPTSLTSRLTPLCRRCYPDTTREGRKELKQHQNLTGASRLAIYEKESSQQLSILLPRLTSPLHCATRWNFVLPEIKKKKVSKKIKWITYVKMLVTVFHKLVFLYTFTCYFCSHFFLNGIHLLFWFLSMASFNKTGDVDFWSLFIDLNFKRGLCTRNLWHLSENINLSHSRQSKNLSKNY